MPYRTLEVEREDTMARVWLNRPERRNALNSLALEEIVDCFTRLQVDFGVRVVMLGGRGPTFCAGADRRDPPGASRRASEGPEATPRELRHLAQLGRRAVAAVEALEAVTVARVQGHAIGGGFALALACDFRLAAEDALFQIPEVDLGIPLTWGVTPRLIRELGPLRARELILLGERIPASRALDWGLLNRALPGAELDAEVGDWLQRLAAKPELAVHMTQTQFRGYAATASLGDCTEADGDLLREASRSAAARESFRSR